MLHQLETVADCYRFEVIFKIVYHPHLQLGAKLHHIVKLWSHMLMQHYLSIPPTTTHASAVYRIPLIQPAIYQGAQVHVNGRCVTDCEQSTNQPTYKPAPCILEAALPWHHLRNYLQSNCKPGGLCSGPAEAYTYPHTRISHTSS